MCWKSWKLDSFSNNWKRHKSVGIQLSNHSLFLLINIFDSENKVSWSNIFWFSKFSEIHQNLAKTTKCTERIVIWSVTDTLKLLFQECVFQLKSTNICSYNGNPKTCAENKKFMQKTRNYCICLNFDRDLQLSK